MASLFADLITNQLSTHGGDEDSDTEDLSSLPFPKPLSRPTFSSIDFNTEEFLLSHSQFRTLDDLRSELRSWVDKLENEMETLIEEDWQGYLSLGRGLTGGETGVKDAERRIKIVDREVKVCSFVKWTDVGCETTN
jgi:COG (conserved oligomeric Golgi) complex component, COG2